MDRPPAFPLVFMYNNGKSNMYIEKVKYIMRVRSKIDWWYKLTVWLTVALIVFLIIWTAFHEEEVMAYAVGIVLGCILLGILLWIYFGTYYEFKETYLLCKSGPFVERIDYEKIKSIKPCRNLFSSMALSRERIEIRQHGKGFVTGTTYISPENRDDFIKELRKRCSNCS